MKKLILKIFIFVLTISLGISIGIFVGYAIIEKDQPHFHGPEVSEFTGVPADMLLKFEAGDSFPELNYYTRQQEHGILTELIEEKRCALIFISPDCSACPTHLEQWNQVVTQKLRQNVQEIVLTQLEPITFQSELPEYLNGKTLCFIDLEDFKSRFNLTILPTTVILDEMGKVHHIQYGLKGGIDYDILKFLTTHDI